MSEEFIPQVSAIFIIGLVTGLFAYYIVLCKRVKEFMDKRKDEYTTKFSEYLTKGLEKLPPTQTQQPLSQNLLESIKKFYKDAQLESIELQERILVEAFDIKHTLSTMRDSFFGSIIFFIISIVLSLSVYSSYAIFSFVVALFILLYGLYLFTGITKIFLD